MAVSVPMNLEEISRDVGHLRKNSIGSSIIKDNESKVLPNYLRPSMGSCHDFCKYGAKRDPAAMVMTTMPEKLPLSPNKGRETDKSNNPQKKKSLFCTTRSPSTVRNAVPQVRVKEIQPGAKKMAATAKYPHKLKLKPLEVNRAPKGGRNNEIDPRGRNNEINPNKEARTSKAGKKSILVPATGSLSQKPEVRKVLKEASHVKNGQNTSEGELKSAGVADIPEKILFITEQNSENQPEFTQEENICDDSLQCQKQINVSSASMLEETEDVNYIDKEIDQAQYSSSSSPKESIGSRSHEGDYGTKSSSSSLVSLLSSSSEAKADYLPLMRRVAYYESDGNENESVKVVLQHQNVEEKRSAEGLFNYVIEETARELANKRKGTVKALVGAFETVISLQDLSLLEQFRSRDLPRIP